MLTTEQQLASSSYRQIDEKNHELVAAVDAKRAADDAAMRAAINFLETWAADVVAANTDQDGISAHDVRVLLGATTDSQLGQLRNGAMFHLQRAWVATHGDTAVMPWKLQIDPEEAGPHCRIRVVANK